MAERQGLLCATLELHRRSSAFANRRSPARLSLVVEPFLQGSNPDYIHQLQKKHHKGASFVIGGETGIRTLGTLTSTTDFESIAFDHSAISPYDRTVIKAKSKFCKYYLKTLTRSSKGRNVFSPAGSPTLPKGICAHNFQLSGTPNILTTSSSINGL